MNEFVQSAGRWLGAMLVAWAAAGCTALQPYRTTDANPPPACDPDEQYQVALPCQAAVLERSAHYDLYFTEFTDQGLQYPAEEFPQAAAYQINRTLQGLKQTAATPGVQGISLVVFVHGWKHDARHDDGNVRDFRALLQSAGLLEQARGSGYRVVGIYVGWRGRSLGGGPLANLSFWSRKSAALRVAQGSTRELLSRLRNFKCTQSLPAGSDGDCDEAATSRLPRVRMLLVGHSFGGWIVYNAVAGSLIESLTHAHNTDRPGSANSRFGDMVVLLNPAFEATRYTPLHRIATTTRQPGYQAPLLVSVTSSADWATRSAFPVGRIFNSVFERTVGTEERVASVRTMGHVRDYITHELRATDEQPAGCAGWVPLRQVTGAQARQQARVNLQAEQANAEAFGGAGAPLPAGWQRTFCGGARLTHTAHDPNSIIWNVRTDGSIMNGHDDIDDPKLIDFVRQLYHDTLPQPLAGGPGGAPTASRPAAPAATAPAPETRTAPAGAAHRPR